MSAALDRCKVALFALCFEAAVSRGKYAVRRGFSAADMVVSPGILAATAEQGHHALAAATNLCGTHGLKALTQLQAVDTVLARGLCLQRPEEVLDTARVFDGIPVVAGQAALAFLANTIAVA